MTSGPEFLTVEEVELLHREQLRLFGGLDGIRDRGALEAAVAVPASSFGGEFLHDPEGLLYDAMIGISAGTVSKEQLAKTLESLAVPYTDD